MALDYTAELIAVKTIPEQDGLTDIVKKVEWIITFFDTEQPEATSIGQVRSVLNTDSIDSSSFVAWENMTQVKILEFALAQEGGSAFLTHLLEHGHSAMVAEKKLDLSYNKKDPELIPRGD